MSVAGGKGRLGRPVVEELTGRGDGRSPGSFTRVDLTTGSGLDELLANCDAVIDARSIATTRRSRAVEFFTAVSQQFLGGAQRANPHARSNARCARRLVTSD